MRNVAKVPPDGGYGWVVAFAMALNNFIYIPMMQCLGLVFKDTFKNLNFSASQAALILNLHASFGLIIGLLFGVLLKFFGYRKVAFLAAIFYFLGVTATAFASNFGQFIFCFGIIASLGVGMSRASFNLALNTFFKERRSRAISFTLTLTGLGSILMPQLVNLLMQFHTCQGVVLIVGGVCSHFFLSAMLLQPVKWHMKEVELKEDKQTCREDSVAAKERVNSFVAFFDLDLLTDPIFVNILVGIAFAVFSELNFTILTPFILNDFGFTTNQIATFISTTGLADISSRLVAPYLEEYLNVSPRHLVILTLIILMILRLVFLFTTNFYLILLAAIGLGIAKGIRRVFMGVIIPSHVDLQKLPSASGMEMMSNGVSILAGGSILGFARDWTGSYSACIIIMNCVTFLTVFLWILEGLITKYKPKKTEKNAESLPLNEL